MSRYNADFAVFEWIVQSPLGWTVSQALSSVSAATSRTSPTMMRSGRSRIVFFRSRDIDLVAGVQRDRIVRGAADLSGILENHQPVVGRVVDDLRDDGVGERCLARSRVA